MIDGLLMEYVITLAKKIFDDYNANRQKEGKEIQYKTWQELPDDLKYSNIRQAENISVKLDLINCYVALKDDPNPEVKQFTDDEIITLAIKEHELWVDERESTGWAYGEKKDLDKKISPYLLPWDEIPKDIQKYDIEASENIIPLLNSVGLKVCRREIKQSVRTRIKKYNLNKLPIIISVTGHRSLLSYDVPFIQKNFIKMLEHILDLYPNTDVIVMSALAKGADRIIANATLNLHRDSSKNQAYLAPVFPMSFKKYMKSLEGSNYHNLVKIKKILDNNKTLSPLILCDDSVNNITAYRRLSAYLIANSHIMVGVWDGKYNGKRGGTSDTLRMAYNTIDNDLLNSISPMSYTTKIDCATPNRFINGSYGPSIYWISANIQKFQPNYRKYGFVIQSDNLGNKYYHKGNRIIKSIEDYLSDEHRRSRDESEYIELDEPLDFEKEKIGSVRVGLSTKHHLALGKIDSLNDDIVKFYKKEEKAKGRKKHTSLNDDAIDDSLVSGTTSSECNVRDNKCLIEMLRRYNAVNNIANSYQKKSEFIILLLISLSTISGLFFSLLLLFGGSVILVAIYSIIYIITLALSFLHTYFKEHSKHISYRCLAETMRVQFYWALSEVNDSVGMCCYSYRNEDMFWLSGSLKSFGSYFSNDYSSVSAVPIGTRISCVKNSWIIEKKTAINDRDEKTQKDNYLSTVITKLFSYSNVILAAVVIIMGLLFVEQATVIIYHIDFINSDITNSIALKLIMVICTSVTSAVLWKQNLSTMKSNIQARADCVLLDNVIDKLNTRDTTSEHKNLETKQSILHEFGVRVVDECCDWLIESSKKDFVRKQRGVRSSDHDSNDGE